MPSRASSRAAWSLSSNRTSGSSYPGRSSGAMRGLLGSRYRRSNGTAIGSFRYFFTALLLTDDGTLFLVVGGLGFDAGGGVIVLGVGGSPLRAEGGQVEGQVVEALFGQEPFQAGDNPLRQGRPRQPRQPGRKSSAALGRRDGHQGAAE